MSRHALSLSQWFVLGLSLALATPALQARGLPDFTELVEEASPAVVNISTVKSTQGGLQGFEGGDIPEIFRRFFGDNFGDPQQPSPREQQQSSGSGFIISKDGYILTNNHVIDGADGIIVRLNDRRELEATLVGADPATDLALLKVEADDLPVAKIGNSTELKVGEWVLAIGSPFGFDYTVTAGIVSAKQRSLPRENYVPFIQTDVAINPGNSGGPLYNLDGEVVGINSQIYTRSGGFIGLSFAIPVNVAMNVVDQLKANGRVSRGWLGVLIQEVNKDLAESFGLDKPAGALVAQVLENSPAEAAGLQEGDVIIKFNGVAIGLSSELPPLVGQVPPGSKAKVDIMRARKRKSVDITIGELPTDNQVAQVAPSRSAPQTSNRLNVEVAELTDEQKQAIGVDQGVLVTGVSEGPAVDAGIRENDVISNVNNRAVDSVERFLEVLDELPADKSIPVLIVRAGSPLFVVVKLE